MPTFYDFCGTTFCCDNNSKQLLVLNVPYLLSVYNEHIVYSFNILPWEIRSEKQV